MSNRPHMQLLGVPSSVGAYAPGQEDAPAALRDLGIVHRLESVGRSVTDLGDLPLRRWSPDPAHPRAQNVSSVVEVAQRTADRLRGSTCDDITLVIGGDCTVELGVIAAQQARGERIGVIYMDLHADLNTPATTSDGALDWMGVAHLLQVDGTDPTLRSVAKLEAGELCYLGVGLNHLTSSERDVVEGQAIPVISRAQLARDPRQAARDALASLGKADRVLIHLDADMIDFNDAPLSEHIARGTGVTLDTAITALDELLHIAPVATVTLTEVNPHHGAPDGSTLLRLVDELAEAFRP